MQSVRPIPCQHTRPAAGCVWCRLALSDPRYGRLFGVSPSLSPQIPPNSPKLPPNSPNLSPRGLPCVHFGAPTGETVTCPSCRGGTLLKTFACAVHGSCTPGKAAPGTACCATCPDYQAGAAPPITPPADPGRRFPHRSCLYHVYPLPSGGRVWRRGLGMLLARAALFTGRRVISCMTGPGLEPPGEVRRLAEPAGFEVFEFSNDRNLREAKTLLELLPLFQTDEPGRALFFGHAKGVTRPDNPGVTCHPWAVLCHEVCLDYWPLAESQLRSFPVTGPFRKAGRCFAGSASAWHYSGSFAWLRSRELFARDWRRVDRQWWGAEAAPGLWYRPAEAGCLFWPGTLATLDLYKMEQMRDVLAAYALWRAEHEGMRTERMAAAS